MNRKDRAIEIATALVEARAEVARLEAEMDELFDGKAPARARIDSKRGTSTRPGRRSRKEATPPESSRSPGEPPIPSANGTSDGRAGRGERRAQIVTLYNQGVTDAGEIAAKLGITRKIAGMALWRARKDGDFPKAVKSR